MLVTISGMVGSGKSTAASHVVALLADDEIAAASWRFQTLPCFHLRRPKPTESRRRGASPPSAPTRGVGYRRRRLTAWRTAGYIARIIAFQLFRLTRRSQAIVLNRYFYDSFVHYALERPTERAFAALLSRLVPVPDVAILTVASPETVAHRRPEYSREYLTSVHDGYAGLATRFPNLVPISTDAPKPVARQAIEDLLKRRGQRDAMKNLV